MFGFELVLYYPAGTSTRFDDDNLTIKGNMGNSYTEIWWREGQASQNCYAGNYLDDNIEGAGITGFGGRILGNFPPGRHPFDYRSHRVRPSEERTMEDRRALA